MLTARTFSYHSFLTVILLAAALLLAATGFAEKRPGAFSADSIVQVKAEKESPVVSETIRIAQKQNGRAFTFFTSCRLPAISATAHAIVHARRWHIPQHGTFLFLHMLKLF